MITFETQEDFDKAVMDALHKYLQVHLFMIENCSKIDASVLLIDTQSDTYIGRVSDYCLVNSKEG